MDGFDREILASSLRAKGLFDQFLDQAAVLIEDGKDLAEAWDIVSDDFGGVPDPESVDDASIWRALSMVSMDRKAAPRDEAEWVIKHFGIDVRRIDPDRVPSSGAVTMLRWTTEVGMTEFMKTIYAKLMPSKSELDQQARFKQSGRVLEETLAEVAKAYESSITHERVKEEKRERKVDEMIEKMIEERVQAAIAGETGEPI